jgi:hypothetical protein
VNALSERGAISKSLKIRRPFTKNHLTDSLKIT